jgi:hypothetical protein
MVRRLYLEKDAKQHISAYKQLKRICIDLSFRRKVMNESVMKLTFLS